MNLNFDRILSRIYKLLKIGILAFLLLKFLSLNVSASDIHYDVTNSVYTNTAYCNSNQKGLCVADTSSTSYSRYTFGTTSYQNTVAIDFMLNYTIPANVNATIRLTGSNWANVPYKCSGTSYMTNCRVVRANSSILNINFTSINNGVGGETFHIDAGGSVLNTNDTFYVQKADLYATYINSNDATNQDVINNQNQNTEDLINNNNQNTQDIIKQVQDLIANNEELQQQLLESQNCPVGPLELYRPDWAEINNAYLDSNGAVVNSNGYGISPYIVVIPNKEYSIITTGGNVSSTIHYCTYTSSKQKQYCYSYNSGNTATNTFTVNQYVQFIRISLQSSRTFALKGPVCNNWEREAQQKMNDTAIDTNNYLKDDSNPSVDSQGIENTMNSVNQSNPLEYFLTLPTTLINATITGLNSNSCTAWKIGRFGTIGRHDLSNYEFTFPCINLRQKLGDDLFLIIDTFVAVGILTMTVVNLYHTISNYITLGAEDEVRSHSSFLSPMDFLGNILGGNVGGIVSHMKE